MKTKLAILDVDGTLFDGNMGIEYLKVLISSKVFNEEIGNQIFAWYGKYKSGEVEKNVAVDEIYRLYAIGMTGLDLETIQTKADETWEIIKPKVYTFAPKLINLLKVSGFTIVLLSGSPVNMVKKLGLSLGLDQNNLLGGLLESKDNKCTGKIISYPGDSEQKVAIINSFIQENNIDIDWSGSLAMGDNEREAGLMKLVGHPIAINPNPALTKLAFENHWIIVDENNILEKISATFIK